MSETTTFMYPSFLRARALANPALRDHFPKSVGEAQAFQPHHRIRALSARVLVVAVTRVECAWRASVDAVPGQDHRAEYQQVVDYGAPVDEPLARVLFPEFDGVPYVD